MQAFTAESSSERGGAGERRLEPKRGVLVDVILAGGDRSLNKPRFERASRQARSGPRSRARAGLALSAPLQKTVGLVAPTKLWREGRA